MAIIDILQDAKLFPEDTSVINVNKPQSRSQNEEGEIKGAGYPAFGIPARAITLFSLSLLLCNTASAGGEEMHNVEIHRRIIPYERQLPSMDPVLRSRWHGLMHSLTHSTLFPHFHLHTYTQPSI